MKRPLSAQSRRYQAQLLVYLAQGPEASLDSVQGVGIGLPLLDLARLHEETLVHRVLPDYPTKKRPSLIRLAGLFFSKAIEPIPKIPGTIASMASALSHQKKIIQTLSQHSVELASSNVELRQEIAQRKAAEVIFKKSERHYYELLKRSDQLQEQSRRLSRQIISAQEEERREISRELHDVIAQALAGINVRLATLKKEAALNTHGLDRNITLTQKLVEKSVNIVHQFARELRPAVLDDLGLIPALHSYLKDFTTRTGVHTHLTAFAGVEQLDADRRTVLFRIAQEALTNVARHAHASKVEVQIRKLADRIRLTIKDDGKAFDVDRTLQNRRGKRLGLLGLRERVEMFSGVFSVESILGKGTTVTAEIPPGKKKEAKGSKNHDLEVAEIIEPPLTKLS